MMTKFGCLSWGAISGRVFMWSSCFDVSHFLFPSIFLTSPHEAYKALLKGIFNNNLHILNIQIYQWSSMKTLFASSSPNKSSLWLKVFQPIAKLLNAIMWRWIVISHATTNATTKELKFRPEILVHLVTGESTKKKKKKEKFLMSLSLIVLAWH